MTKWKRNTPREVNRNEVEAVLNYFFEGKYRWDGTSHIVVQHDELIDEYPPYGEIAIPCKGGKRIKGRYIKELMRAIELLGLWSES